jgi:hypothetical protein
MAPLHKRKAKQCDSSHVIHGRMELDLHADTIVLGSNAIIIHFTSRECNVLPYADTFQPIVDVPIVTGATAVTSPQTGLTYILVFNEAIWMGDVLDHSLINPNQLRAFGITVQDNPYSPTAMHIAAETDDFLFPMSADFSAVTAQELSERWFIGLTQAHETIRVTGSAVLPLSRRYRADRIFEKPKFEENSTPTRWTAGANLSTATAMLRFLQTRTSSRSRSRCSQSLGRDMHCANSKLNLVGLKS